MTKTLLRALATALMIAPFAGAPSCGASTVSSKNGTDSHTHWLMPCDDDTECGDLECHCGVCTRRCDDLDACEGLSGSLACRVPDACAPRTENVCVAQCEVDADCPGSARCASQVCRRRTSSSDAGAVRARDASPNPACAPMDARSSGRECAELSGYAWNGFGCEPVVCGCVGADCGEISETERQCYEAFDACRAPSAQRCGAMDARSGDLDCATPSGYAWNGTDCMPLTCGCQGDNCNARFETAASCRRAFGLCFDSEALCAPMDARPSGDECADIVGFAWEGGTCLGIECGCEGTDCDELFPTLGECVQTHLACEPGVSTACEKPSDCALASAGCCGTCGAAPIGGVVSIDPEAWEAHQSAACGRDFGCPECVTGIQPTVYAVCDGGECGAVDAEPFAECSTDEDCVVRARECCECGADVSPGGLLAVSDPVGYAASVCGGVQACDGCEPIYPPGVTALCDEFGRCVLGD